MVAVSVSTRNIKPVARIILSIWHWCRTARTVVTLMFTINSTTLYYNCLLLIVGMNTRYHTLRVVLIWHWYCRLLPLSLAAWYHAGTNLVLIVFQHYGDLVEIDPVVHTVQSACCLCVAQFDWRQCSWAHESVHHTSLPGIIVPRSLQHCTHHAIPCAVRNWYVLYLFFSIMKFVRPTFLCPPSN